MQIGRWYYSEHFKISMSIFGPTHWRKLDAEINETQELYYLLLKAIFATGYKGLVAQEFIPIWDDKIAALKKGFILWRIQNVQSRILRRYWSKGAFLKVSFLIV